MHAASSAKSSIPPISKTHRPVSSRTKKALTDPIVPTQPMASAVERPIRGARPRRSGVKNIAAATPTSSACARTSVP